MRRIFLIDCPGVVQPSGETETEIILKNVVSTVLRGKVMLWVGALYMVAMIVRSNFTMATFVAFRQSNGNFPCLVTLLEAKLMRRQYR